MIIYDESSPLQGPVLISLAAFSTYAFLGRCRSLQNIESDFKSCTRLPDCVLNVLYVQPFAWRIFL